MQGSNELVEPVEVFEIDPIIQLLWKCDDFIVSDGSAGNLVADSSGQLTLNGNPISNLSLGNGNTLGTAYDAVTTINGVDQFIIPAGATVYLVGTVKIDARRAVIDGTLNGNGGGYPGGESPPDTSGHGKGGISSGGSQSGGGGGSNGMSKLREVCFTLLCLSYRRCFFAVVKFTHVAGSGGIGGEQGCSSDCNLCDYNLCSNCRVNQPEINRYCTHGINEGGKPGDVYDDTLPLTLRPGYTPLVVESLTNEWGSLGQYFTLDVDTWVANFGLLVDSKGVADNVKVCRSGSEIWSGSVKVFSPSYYVFGSNQISTHIGRRDPTSTGGDWQVNDIIVPSSSSCLYDVRPGSGGGAGAGLSSTKKGGAGGAGGAAIHLYGAEIVLNGNIYANGSNGGRGPYTGYGE